MLILLPFIFLSLFIPNWLLIVFVIPSIRLLSYQDILPVLFNIGPARIYLFDFLLLIVLVKLLFTRQSVKQNNIISIVYSALLIFLSSLSVGIIVAYFQFGEKVFDGELAAFLRFLSQISIILLLNYSITTTKQLIYTNKLVDYLGLVIAGFIFLNMYFFKGGLTIGEVQKTADTVRYFGILGDSVGYILLFYIIRHIIAKNIVSVLFYSLALMATGTRGPFISLGFCFLLIFICSRSSILRSSRYLLFVLIVLAITGLGLFSDLGGMRTRFVDPNNLESSLTQRLLSMKLALQVFVDHPFFGVGYTGFRYIAEENNAEGIFRLKKGEFSPNYTATTYNQFLQVATDGGVIALLSFVWLMRVILLTLKSVVRYVPEPMKEFFEAGYLWLLTMLISAQTVSWILPASLISYFLWIIVGSSLAALRLSIPSYQFQETPNLMLKAKSV